MEASCVITVADNSREANEADAQSVRVAVLIDELVQKHETILKADAPSALAAYKRPHLVVEVLESRNCGALDFSTEIGAQRACLLWRGGGGRKKSGLWSDNR